MNIVSTVLRAVTALVIAGLLATCIYYRWQNTKKDTKLIALSATVATQSEANKSLEQSVERMVRFRKVDQEALSQLVQNQAAVLKQAAAVTVAIANLRATNATVDKYLREPIPVPLRNLLNGLRDSAGNADCGNKNNRCDAAKAAH